jgi:ComF family protein
MIVTAGINALISALLAPECAACGALLDHPLTGCVCKQCWDGILRITPPLCQFCGDPLPRGVDCCDRCRRRDRVIDRARAIGEYDGALRQIVHALKYDRRLSTAPPLAALMAHAGMEMLSEADFVVPVPLHWRREYKRGFNQARELARHLGLLVVDALVRVRATRSQVELAADRRPANVEGAFSIRQNWFTARADVTGRKVVLVDDVSTTGATLEICAGVLKRAGASEVYALTAARVVTKRR